MQFGVIPSFFPRDPAVSLDEHVSARPFLSREADLGSHQGSCCPTQRHPEIGPQATSLSSLLLGLFVCLLEREPRRRSGVSTYPDTVNEQTLGLILGMRPVFPSNMALRSEPSIWVSSDQRRLFAIV